MARRKVIWRTKEAVAIARKAGLDALRTGGERLLTDAINETPIESGTLRRSGTVTVGALPSAEQVYQAAKAGKAHKKAFPGAVGKEPVVYVSFNTPYALRQHEELDYNHPRGGDAKYLERTYNFHKRKIKRMTQLRIKKALRDAR